MNSLNRSSPGAIVGGLTTRPDSSSHTVEGTFTMPKMSETRWSASTATGSPGTREVHLRTASTSSSRATVTRSGVAGAVSGAGTAVTAGVLGAMGSIVSPSAIFLSAAALCAPALIALSRIRADEIDHARARNAPADRLDRLARVIDLTKNCRLVAFSACLALFQFGNASLLPLVSETFGATNVANGSFLISGLIIGPQIVVAIMSPLVGFFSEMHGRKPLLLIGLSIEAIRALLFAFVTNYWSMVAVELLDGVTGSIINVMTVLVVTDLTAGTGRFNLAQGVIGAVIAVSAALSTTLSGFLFQEFGRFAGFLTIAAIAVTATATALMALGETKPKQYED